MNLYAKKFTKQYEERIKKLSITREFIENFIDELNSQNIQIDVSNTKRYSTQDILNQDIVIKDSVSERSLTDKEKFCYILKNKKVIQNYFQVHFPIENPLNEKDVEEIISKVGENNNLKRIENLKKYINSTELLNKNQIAYFPIFSSKELKNSPTFSVVKNREELKKIFQIYGILKSQRNFSNHASVKVEERDIALSSIELKNLIKYYIDILNNYN
ncbi:hypothetical protein P261_00146 [Lachnospiraceae bacterium TWA4]|nr:hypothetical protein P261_00146 [Lachnospiraceae bacterium TWA4]